MKVMQSKGISVWLLPPFLIFTTGIYTFGGHTHFWIVKIEIILSQGHVYYWSGEWDCTCSEWCVFLMTPLRILICLKCRFLRWLITFFKELNYCKLETISKTQKPTCMYWKRNEDQWVQRNPSKWI